MALWWWFFGLVLFIVWLIWLIRGTLTPSPPEFPAGPERKESYTTYIAGDGDSLKVGHTCYETHPCQHDVIVNGEKDTWTALDIYGWFYDRKMLPPPDAHIASYKELYQERVLDWGVFTRAEEDTRVGPSSDFRLASPLSSSS